MIMTDNPDLAKEKILIIGQGLIGGSISKALAQHNHTLQLRLYDTDEHTQSLIRSSSLSPYLATSLEDEVASATLILLAVPLAITPVVVDTIAPHLTADTIITDIGSVKAPLVAFFDAILPPTIAFVPGHPIAGSEKTGFQAASDSLFEDKKVILTPLSPESEGLDKVIALWQACNATVEFMPPDIHDRVYAYVSHLPQLIAFAIAEYMHAYPDCLQGDIAYSRFTRLCYSSKPIWQDIFQFNQENISETLSAFQLYLHQIIGELSEGKEQEVTLSDIQLTQHILPRIIASCLVTTALQAEHTMGISLKAYAGSGFNDMTAPVKEAPESDLELISQAAPQVVACLSAFSKVLKHIERQYLT